MLKFFKHLLTLFLISNYHPCFAQNDSIAKPLNTKRLLLLTTTEAALYSSSIVLLNDLWYKNYPRTSFHFFNDNAEWLQMDKAGHMITAYHIGKIEIELMKWAGMQPKAAIWYGGAIGSIYQTTIEILDGFSGQWGFSLGDVAANSIGSFLLIAQELAWNEQKMMLKHSFHQTIYPQYRPAVLGNTLLENVLKDYNGQTYWLSINLSSFASKQTKLPKWLNVSLGYGAEGMTGAVANSYYTNKNASPIMFERVRKYYLSFDADLTRIKTKSKFLHQVFLVFGFIKIPSPTLVFRNNKMQFLPLYY